MSKTVSEHSESDTCRSVAMGFKIREIFDTKEAVKLVKATGGCIQLYSPSTLLYHMCIALVSPRHLVCLLPDSGLEAQEAIGAASGALEYKGES